MGREYFIVWINDESVFKCVFVLSSGLWSGWRSRDEEQMQQRHREHTKQKCTTPMQCLCTGICTHKLYIYIYFTLWYWIHDSGQLWLSCLISLCNDCCSSDHDWCQNNCATFISPISLCCVSLVIKMQLTKLRFTFYQLKQKINKQINKRIG